VLDFFSSCDLADETVQPRFSITTSKIEEPNRTMMYHNLFASLKYTVEAVSFFDAKLLPLNYFIEGCEEVKFMLPDEAEPQFTKVKTRIVGEARRTIQDFNSVA